jgi:cytochrome c biogenesis protein CcmG/thiol:disulfide interchange protein DsbE
MPLAFVCLAASFFSACQQSARRAAPLDFTLPDANGAAIILSAYKGKVVLLDFWATWCTGCKVEIPWYMEFAKSTSKAGWP